jgi:hypothetical protein
MKILITLLVAPLAAFVATLANAHRHKGVGHRRHLQR